MAPTPRPEQDEPRHGTQGNRRDAGTGAEDVEQDSNVERGERLDSGKTIARGGKDTGHVPGADESTPDK